jgi:hypothetical protein
MGEITNTFSISFSNLPVQATAPEFLNTPMDPPGAIESEVGDPAPVPNIPFNGKTTLDAYFLRSERKGKGRRVPSHQFGKMRMGNAFCSFALDVYNIPAVGTKVTIQPKMRATQRHLCNLYRYMRADALYIIQVPTVLGMSGKFFIYAPESDANARTRGVYWQWSSSGYIVLYLPFSSDLPVQNRDVPRQGMCGLSLCIENQIDNTSEGPVSPLTFNVWSCVMNIQCTEYMQDPTASEVYTGLRFTPVENPKPPPPTPKGKKVIIPSRASWGYVQMDGGVDIAGGADVNEQEQVRASEPTTAVVPTPAEGTKIIPASKAVNTRAAKQTKSIAQKWTVIKTATIKSTDVGKEFTVTIDPKVRPAKGYKGEDVSRPYCRNQFVSGQSSKGYVTIAEITVRTTKSPYVAGIVQISDSKTGFGNQIYAEIGGGDVIFQLMADQHADTAGREMKYASQAWISTRAATFTFKYKVVNMNRTSEVNDIDITFSYRLGSAQFHVPKKAVKPVAPVVFDWIEESLKLEDATEYSDTGMQALAAAMQSKRDGRAFAVVQSDDMWNAMEEYVKKKEDITDLENGGFYDSVLGDNPFLEGESGDDYMLRNKDRMLAYDENMADIFTAHGGDEEVSTMIAPAAGEQPSAFAAILSMGSDDMLEQNENWQCIGKFDLPVDGTIAVLPINIPVISDIYADDGDNPITETCRRYAQLIPASEGQLGPVMGQYVIHCRVPTTETANIAHICAPGDMNESMAELFFGLSNVLSIATSALSSVGGPLLSTAFNMANAATGGIAKPLLGAAGSLIPPATKLIGKLINPAVKTPADVMAPIIGGDIPIGRFLNLLKPVMTNERNEPSLPTLALQVIDFLGSTLARAGTLPVSVYCRVGDVKVEREVFDRDVVYEETEPAIWITTDEGARIITKLVEHERREEALVLATLFAKNYFGENHRTVNVLEFSRTVPDMGIVRDYYRSLLTSPQEREERSYSLY